jgi:hypothetical protein
MTIEKVLSMNRLSRSAAKRQPLAMAMNETLKWWLEGFLASILLCILLALPGIIERIS